MSKAQNAVEENRLPQLLRAIIVEDQIEYQLQLFDALEVLKTKCHVHSFSFGRECASFIEAFNGELNLALVDLGLPDMNGEVLISKLRQKFPSIKILVVSTLLCKKRFCAAIKEGADGYIVKDDEIFDISAGISQVIAGNSPISPALNSNLVYALRREVETYKNTEVSLSKREMELLECINDGLSYDAAAYRMGLMTSTVHTYSRNLFRKLKVRSQVQAIRAARLNGLLTS